MIVWKFIGNLNTSVKETRGRDILYKVLHGEAPPQGRTPYHFLHDFDRKGIPFVYLKLKKGISFTYFRNWSLL